MEIPREQAEAHVERLVVWRAHAPSSQDVLSAIRLQRRERMSFGDGAILTSAAHLGCAVLWSEGLSAGQRYGGVTVENPFAA